MSNTRYDPAIIQKFADRLYAQANTVIVLCSLVGVAGGGVGGYVVATPATKSTCAVIGGVIFGLLGLAIGSGRAFLLKLQAQVALCQKQIEENTRK